MRRKVEENLHELKERHRESSGTESSSSGDESDSSSEPRSKKKDRRESRDKKKVGLSRTGGRSSERGNRCKARSPSKSSKEKPVQKRHRVHSTTKSDVHALQQTSNDRCSLRNSEPGIRNPEFGIGVF